uniref:Uncharacterized protein n=1 Tax=Rhizophora mucronata TaxID=61149 RepID=A0A2P2KEP4_RHIMU
MPLGLPSEYMPKFPFIIMKVPCN